MSTTADPEYAAFCGCHALPWHFQPWWLEAVCSGAEWGVATMADRGGELVGIWPWYRVRRLGVAVIRQPPLTAYTGPWLAYPAGLSRPGRYAFQHKVYAGLARRLPGAVFFRQSLHPAVVQALPFIQQGFRQTTRYTYRFESIPPDPALERGFRGSLRTDLRKARRLVTAERDDASAGLAFGLYRRSLKRQGLRPPCDAALFLRLHEALAARGRTAVFVARDRNAEAQAALYLVHDERDAAVLLTGTDPAFKASGAVFTLFWEALVFARARGLSFDFEGSMAPSIERVFRRFGAPLVPYHQVWRPANRWVGAAVEILGY
jgi:hypothetical protein